MSAATASSESSSPLQQLQTTMSSLQQQQQQQQRFELYSILSVFCVLFCNLYLYQFLVLLFYFGSLILPLLLMGTSNTNVPRLFISPQMDFTTTTSTTSPIVTTTTPTHTKHTE
jgi:hypothetical protein